MALFSKSRVSCPGGYWRSQMPGLLSLFFQLNGRHEGQGHRFAQAQEGGTVAKTLSPPCQALADARLLRHLLPFNGTALHTKNDTLPDVLKPDFQQWLQEVSCQAPDFSKSPSRVLRRPGGCVYTSKGYHRSPGKYLVARHSRSALQP